MLLLLALRAMPDEANWLCYAGQTAHDFILDRINPGGIVIASLLAYLASEFSNSIIMAVMQVATKGQWLWMRTLASTIIGEGVDTLLFVMIAPLTGIFQWEVFANLVFTNSLFKVGVEVVFTQPLIK